MSPRPAAGRPSRARRSRHPTRLVAMLLLVAGLVASLAGTALAQDEEPAGPTIDIVELEGLLDRTWVRYLDGVLETAAAEGSELVVVTLDSPGGLAAADFSFVQRVAEADVPVVAWVGPPGATARSAAAGVASAAHVLALAPGTTFGAATPFDLGDADGDARAGDVTRTLVDLAAERDRASGAAQAIARDGVVYAVLPAGAPAELSPDAELPAGVEAADVFPLDETDVVERGIADVTAPGLDDLLRSLDGREVTLASGETRALDVDPVASSVRFNNPGVLARVLHAAATPEIAYLLLVAGLLALAFEWLQPGFGVAGLAGAALAAFGLYGMVVLPVSGLGLLLLLAGLALLAADLAVGGLGAMTLTGTVGFVAGSWLLLPAVAPLQLAPWLIALVTLGVVLFFVVVMTVVLRAQGADALSGAEGAVGKTGVVRSTLNPSGYIFVDGALWRARAPEDAGKVRTGTEVRVTGLRAEEQALDVELVDAAEQVSR